jgi:tripartite-type tricarboxylate transporter receptor subunit TctC
MKPSSKDPFALFPLPGLPALFARRQAPWRKRRRAGIAVLGLALLQSLAAGPATAQAAWPSKPVRVIVPVPAGSGMDNVARIALDRMGQNMSQVFVIENIAGANTNIGTAAVARAAPDGYTLLVSTDALPLNGLIYHNLAYDPLRDLQMLGTIARAVFILSVIPALPVQSTEAFIAYAKARPGQIPYGSSGIGSPHHIAMELFSQAAGVELLHVPFKGSGDSVTAMLGGSIQAAMGLPSSFAPHVLSGRFRALAVTAAHRVPAFPQVPTLAEGGVKGAEYESWYGLFAPAGTPRPILERLHAELSRVLRDKAYTDEKLGKIGLDPFESASPEAAAALVQTYYEKLAPVVKKAAIRMD